MRRIPRKHIFTALAISFMCAQSFTVFAKTDLANPNAATKKTQGPPKVPAGPPEIPGGKALADLQSAQKRNNEMSVIHFTQNIQKDGKDSSAYANRGKAYSGLHDYDKALADFNKALELDPKQVEAYKGRAVVKYMKKDYAGSWEDVRQVEALGDAMWPAFLEALKTSSGKKS